MSFLAGLKPHYKAHLRLAIPVMFSQMGHVVVQITDSMMLGHYDTTALAASTFGSSVFVIGLVVCIGFSFAMTPLVGAAAGARDVKAAARWFRAGSVANLVIGLAIAAIMLSLYPFLDRMGQSPEVVAQAKPFYLLIVMSIVPLAVFQSYKQFAEGLGNTRIALLITIQELILNIGLNAVLIYGLFGFPELGIVGSGTASFIARLSMPVAYIFIFRKLDFFKPWREPIREATLRMVDLKRYVSLGLPMAGQFLLEVGAFAGGGILVGWLGKNPQAAHQIAMGVASFTFMGASGIAAAATIRVSQFFGAGNRSEMRKAGIAAGHIVLAYMSLMAIGLVLFRKFIPLLYTKDLPVIAIASGLLFMAALFQLFDGLQVVMLACLRGLTDARMPTLYAFIAYVVITLPMSYVCGFKLGMREYGIWTGFIVGLIVASLLFAARFLKLSGNLKTTSQV